MTLEANVLRPNSVRATADGYEVDVHLAWYRSLPLSCVENVSVSIAGKNVARDSIQVLYQGRKLALDDLPDLVDDWWFIQDALTLQVADSNPIAAGDKTTLEVELATRIPYIIIGPDMALVQRTKASREVTVQ